MSYNGRGYDRNGIIIYKLINGDGKIKIYNSHSNILEFEVNI